MTAEMTVSELHCYPVKSCRGISMKVAEVGPRGIQYDRQWMVVDEHRQFVTQRQVASMCRIETDILDDMLVLKAPGMGAQAIPVDLEMSPRRVEIWKAEIRVSDQGEAIADWLTLYLSREKPGRYRLVRIREDEPRQAKSGDAQMAFADGHPFLVISQPSLNDLNVRMGKSSRLPLGMDRFRPNIVLDGCAPYAEDGIPIMTIGDVTLAGRDPCLRCVITTINQQTGLRSVGEPLTTLAKYRKTSKGVSFGRNFNHLNTGVIKVGDTVRVSMNP